MQLLISRIFFRTTANRTIKISGIRAMPLIVMTFQNRAIHSPLIVIHPKCFEGTGSVDIWMSCTKLIVRHRTRAVIGICLALPLLTAATVEQWRQREPRWIGQSQKPLDQLVGCLGSKYAGTLSANIQAMLIERGMSYTNSGINRDILVDVTDDGDHRTIKLWLRNFFGITAGAKEQIAKLSACAGQSPAG